MGRVLKPNPGSAGRAVSEVCHGHKRQVCWHLIHEFAVSDPGKTGDTKFLNGKDSALFVSAPIYLSFRPHSNLEQCLHEAGAI